MREFLGMPLYVNYDRIPEREYVDWVRKRVAVSKLTGWVLILGGCVILGEFLMLSTVVFSVLEDAPHRGFPTGMVIGALLGIILGMAVVFGAWVLWFGAMAVRGSRTEKLLVRYYDESTAGKSEQAAAADPATGGSAEP